MSNSKNKLQKTLEHNSSLRKKTRAQSYVPKNADSEELLQREDYAKRKGSMNNILKSSTGVLTTLSKSKRNDGENLDDFDVGQRLTDWSELFSRIHERILCRKETNKQITSVFPELETAIEIIIASILSPNKMTNVDLNYQFAKDIELNNEETVSEFMSLISEYIEEHYSLSSELTTIATDMLRDSGSSPHLIIAESVVDDIINSDIASKMSMEDFKTSVDSIVNEFTKPAGLINIDNTEVPLNKEKITVENFVEHLVNNSSLKITDNQGAVVFSKIKKAVRDNIVKNSLRRRGSISVESQDKIGYLDFFRDRTTQGDTKPFVEVKKRDDVERKTIGRPLIKKCPSEAVFPVIAPGAPTDHLGYFVFLDSNGNPVTSTTSEEVFSGINNKLHNKSVGYNNSPITSVYQDLVGDKDCGVDVDGIYNMFTDLMLKKLTESFKDSFYGDNVSVSNYELFYYILFSRSLSGDKTTLLFVPYDNMVYFSLLYDDLGVGKTLLDDTDIISSMRSMLRFARVMSQVRNAIDITKVKVELDPNDVDPEATMMKVQADVLKFKANDFPLGINNQHRLVEWIRSAGLNFEFTGHPDVPVMSVEFDKAGMRYEGPDSELEDQLAEQHINKIGLPAEVLSNAYNADFAAEVLQRSVMYARRNISYQVAYEKHISKFVQLIIWNDGDLREKLKEIIKKNKGVIEESLDIKNKALGNIDEDSLLELYVDKISDNIEVKLPRMSENEISDLSKAFDQYLDVITKAIDILFNEDIFTSENTPGMVDQVKALKPQLISMFMRKWAAENNYLPEVFSVFGEESIEEITESLRTHLGASYKMVIKTIDTLSAIKEEGGDDIKIIENNQDDSSDSGSSW